ncbi:I78 family peptidase inhibitor [Jiella sp. M17.18]|uniref:I78 family peptidase inhibitor n=1 Tax=Jiella sp. M17.18 TaxID=3234247 RepID=UPI0034DFD1B7
MRRAIALAVIAGLTAAAGCSTNERAAPPLAPAARLPPPSAGQAPISSRGAPAPGGFGGAGPAGGAGTCNAQAAGFLVGQIANVEANDKAKAATGAEKVRVLFPGQPITQEFEPNRLDLETNDQNRITSVRCG